MYIVIGKIVVGALLYIIATGLFGLILNACMGNLYMEKEKINFFYFWFVGIFLFALIYEVNY